MAFVSSTLLICAQPKHIRVAHSALPRQNVYNFRSRAVRACASPPKDSSDKPTAAKKQTRAEEITELLGRNVEEEKAKGDVVIETGKEEEKSKWAKVLLSVVIALVFFAQEKVNPVNPLQLYRIMEERSAQVSELGDGRPSVVEFYAPWCSNCKLMAKDVFELEGQYVGMLHWVTVDTDKEENSEIVDQFSVDGIPQFTFLDGKGNEIATLLGKIPRNVLAQDLEALARGNPLPFISGPGDAENISLGQQTSLKRP